MPLGIHTKLQSGATTGNGAAADVNGVGREHVWYIRATGTVAGGAVQIEEAHDPAYTGLWSPIGSPVTVADATVKTVRLTGCAKAVRARISTNITGGATVDVDYFNNSGE